MTQQIGVVGLAVMGKNLAWNIESRGYSVSVFNRSSEKTDEMVKESEGKNIHPTYSMEEFVNSLEKPRKILLMVKAGTATDATIDTLLPLLDDDDILIDGGNTNYQDTIRRNKALAESGVNFIGMGVSGGEVGALTGPSLMPGGQEAAFNKVSHILEAISAKAKDGAPCVAYIGPNGAGHYVKMVHNGIEYADMQLIAESYAMMKDLLGMSHEDIAQTFKDWNAGELSSYLIEITGDIFNKLDDETNGPLVEQILDTAGQKGTGKWTSINALELGIPLTIITESVFARFISSIKEERVNASKQLNGPSAKFEGDKEAFLEKIRKALYMSKICSYAQGFAQMRKASEDHAWNLQLGELAMIWREGCIIRAQFLQKIKEAYDNDSELQNLLLDPYFKDIVTNYQDALRDVVATGVQNGVPTPGFSASINYYDSYRSENLPANLIQAQRDYFGAHTYERKDRSGIFHTQWIDE
ncbi:phosphogluconate dehydrogenase (NADP(+)-dependent, decarboxylating) [Staphylococcus cohnii]|uniref:6-phosphogluconate dehydrogenase, decarboxylating n=1 Tax=Staphylococcus ureilyticus TaxID=94138 RepID=A0AB34AGQ9_STAUR|nr:MULTISPECIES: NADP-dependent phosphogluconate dehydrogenase [Staphylococcus]AQM41825.1 phosphogluconate dehydrogenase (NADP(+)-dependent, decarboxylating) [Staphylococcus cohnii]KKD23004.1 6-phosphogluconate dehydrogenase [Staphylococcus cohnii subsp. cohnii]KKD23610.1 6-phosphogluconate dehydrogenase [Staphylococcus cohnii subsp. cohnii]MBM9446462.1 NADP-dependent phosphogluconate dehydrogenase [Staphylococcus ureilyticus]MCQ9292633.1 NADP-dependent phosphogluconate dehydrogenase [Staphylo